MSYLKSYCSGAVTHLAVINVCRQVTQWCINCDHSANRNKLMVFSTNLSETAMNKAHKMLSKIHQVRIHILKSVFSIGLVRANFNRVAQLLLFVCFFPTSTSNRTKQNVMLNKMSLVFSYMLDRYRVLSVKLSCFFFCFFSFNWTMLTQMCVVCKFVFDSLSVEPLACVNESAICWVCVELLLSSSSLNHSQRTCYSGFWEHLCPGVEKD